MAAELNSSQLSDIMDHLCTDTCLNIPATEGMETTLIYIG